MCHPVPCRTCGKVTWAGCGQHVESALAGVPTANRCTGHPAATARVGNLVGGRS